MRSQRFQRGEKKEKKYFLSLFKLNNRMDHIFLILNPHQESTTTERAHTHTHTCNRFQVSGKVHTVRGNQTIKKENFCFRFSSRRVASMVLNSNIKGKNNKTNERRECAGFCRRLRRQGNAMQGAPSLSHSALRFVCFASVE